MTLEAAEAMVGRRPTWELKNMVKALGFHPWLNTAEDTARREAAMLVIKARSKRGSRK